MGRLNCGTAEGEKEKTMIEKSEKIYVAGYRGLKGTAIWKNLTDKGYSNLVRMEDEESGLRDAAAVKKFFDKEKPKVVVFAAEHGGGVVAKSLYGADMLFDNLQIEQNIIGESFRHGVKKLLFIGGTQYSRFKESEQAIKEEERVCRGTEPIDEPYALSKIAGMKLCESFSLQYGCNYVSIVTPSVYGYGDDFDLGNAHVLPAMMRKIFLAKCLSEGNWPDIYTDLKMRPVGFISPRNTLGQIARGLLRSSGIGRDRVRLLGTGKEVKKFLWSEDMAEVSVQVLLNVDFKDVYKKKNKGIVETGGGEEISIGELAEKIKNVVGFKGEIVWEKKKTDIFDVRLADTEKEDETEQRHKVGIDEGIEKLYKWYKTELENNRKKRQGGR